jgi:hypothetical protein
MNFQLMFSEQEKIRGRPVRASNKNAELFNGTVPPKPKSNGKWQINALRTGAGDYIPFVTPTNSYCHSTENREAVTPVCRAHVECPPSIRRHKRSALPSASPSAAHHLSQIAGQKIGRRYVVLAALTCCPSALSSWHMCPAPPVCTPTKRPLPCSRFAELPLAATCATLPHYGL